MWWGVVGGMGVREWRGDEGSGGYRLTLAAIDEMLQRVTPLRYLPSKSN